MELKEIENEINAIKTIVEVVEEELVERELQELTQEQYVEIIEALAYSRDDLKSILLKFINNCGSGYGVITEIDDDFISNLK